VLRQRGQRLVCASQYTRSRREHGSGEALPADLYPTYFAALKERRVLVANDAASHRLTSELGASYLTRHGISSMLDAPIIRDGVVIGVVCHEHVGAPRTWSQHDIDFACSVADMITLIFEQADRLELEAALQEQAEQRLEAQKMEALGRMACAVAHDFNNLLATIALSVDALGKRAGAEMQPLVSEVEQMIGVSQRLTQQLLTFGKQGSEPPLEAVDLRELIERMLPVIRGGLGKGIALRVELRARDPRVVAHPSQLEQVILNLALNARDAITASGEIAIVLRDATPADDVAPDCIALEVKDDGVGMDEATQARVFEPFFTTKAGGHGLGLATVHGIIRRAGGIVRVQSEPGAGTTMLVALPRAAVP
jgi:signal transduction histidine kinase